MMLAYIWGKTSHNRYLVNNMNTKLKKGITGGFSMLLNDPTGCEYGLRHKDFNMVIQTEPVEFIMITLLSIGF